MKHKKCIEWRGDLYADRKWDEMHCVVGILYTEFLCIDKFIGAFITRNFDDDESIWTETGWWNFIGIV